MTLQTDRDLKLQHLIDRQEIYEVLMRYCRGVDRCDPDLVRAAYHPDAWDDHGPFKGNAWEFADRFSKGRKEVFYHFIGNMLIDVDGDVAHSEAYFVAQHIFDREGKDWDFVLGGRYMDRWERRDGEWKIARRTVVLDWSRQDPITEPWPLHETFVQGLRSRDDPVYQFPASAALLRKD
jgi:hypothetical protein